MYLFGIFGNITSPFSSSGAFSQASQYADISTGLPFFVSTIVRIITIVAGLWMFFNLIIAGMTYLSAQGSQEMTVKAWNMIWQSLVGLLIIVISFALTALISELLFGNPAAILQPMIFGPGSK